MIDTPADGPVHLVALRRALGWSQDELADRAGVSARTIRNIELGAVATPHQATVRRLGTSLHLTADETEKFVALWHPGWASGEVPLQRLIRPLGQLEQVLTPEQLALRRGWSTMATHDHSVLNVERVRERAVVDFVIRAEHDDVRRGLVFYQLSDDDSTLDDVELQRTANCRLVDTVAATQLRIKVFEVEFDTVLHRGDVYRFGYTMGLRTRPRSLRTNGRSGVGVSRAGATVRLEATFPPDALPVLVEYVWRSSALGRELSRQPLRLNERGGAMIYEAAAPVGTHEIAWTWPAR